MYFCVIIHIIGKGNWSSDEYVGGYLDDFFVHDFSIITDGTVLDNLTARTVPIFVYTNTLYLIIFNIIIPDIIPIISPITAHGITRALCFIRVLAKYTHMQ